MVPAHFYSLMKLDHCEMLSGTTCFLLLKLSFQLTPGHIEDDASCSTLLIGSEKSWQNVVIAPVWWAAVYTMNSTGYFKLNYI